MDVPSLIRETLHDLEIDQAELARRLGVGQPTVSKWIKGSGAPDYESCLRLALVSGRPATQVLDIVGLDPSLLRVAGDQSGIPQPAILSRMRSLDQQVTRWMEVMGPRMGEDAAAQRFWQDLVADARRRNELAESLTASRTDITTDDDTANKPVAFLSTFEEAPQEAVAA